MKTLSRRKLIVGATAGAATAGVLAAVPHLSQHTPDATVSSTDPVMAYVTDPTSGNVSILIGDQDITFHDPDLVAQLVRATHR